jgi:hypothetical protein
MGRFGHREDSPEDDDPALGPHAAELARTPQVSQCPLDKR